MTKIILITGATDGIGFETAKRFAAEGHTLLLHGRSRAKLDAAIKAIGGHTTGYIADLSVTSDVTKLAEEILRDHSRVDVVINNAGVLKAPQTITSDGLDLRFMVNTIAPFILTTRLLPIVPADGRIINLSSAAQAPVSQVALQKDIGLSDMDAYAQSKLAITMWSQDLAQKHPNGPVVVSVNPGSLLASKMVKEGFGLAGNDINIGVDILHRAALSPEFAGATGRYFDNDAGDFGSPHPDADVPSKVSNVVAAITATAAKLTSQ